MDMTRLYRSFRCVHHSSFDRRARLLPSIWLTMNPTTRSSQSGKAMCSYVIPMEYPKYLALTTSQGVMIVCRTRIRSGVRRHSHSLRALVLREPTSRHVRQLRVIRADPPPIAID